MRRRISTCGTSKLNYSRYEIDCNAYADRKETQSTFQSSITNLGSSYKTSNVFVPLSRRFNKQVCFWCAAFVWYLCQRVRALCAPSLYVLYIIFAWLMKLERGGFPLKICCAGEYSPRSRAVGSVNFMFVNTHLCVANPFYVSSSVVPNILPPAANASMPRP